MNIVIFGAGAIGSFFGALLSKKNNVYLIGRNPHISTIKRKGLTLLGKTQLNVKISAYDSAYDIMLYPDLLILTVKSYDTKNAIHEALSIINDDTIVLSLQNGLDNIDKIKKVVNPHNILCGVTTHGAILSKPGVIRHTGQGYTVLGELNRKKTERLQHIVHVFNDAGIETKYTLDIDKEIWIKAIINSSINPITTFFNCKNGYLMKNPILENIVERVCRESTYVARSHKINISYQNALKKTKEVIQNTADNYSSMLQSFKRGKKTEIESINGVIVSIGKKYGIDVSINDLLLHLINNIHTL